MIAPHTKAPAARRVVRVWLIAVSLFQRSAGDCRFAAISLANTAGEVRVT